MTTPMHGIVLCAGLGTRLRPLTQALPKPVVPVGTLPAALRNAEQLLDAGIRSVHMNTHYLAEEVEAQVRAAAYSRGWPAQAVRFWNEPEILETGGGIARIIHHYSQELGHSEFWDTVVVSGDIVADIPLDLMMQRWAARHQNETSLMATVPLTTPRNDVTWVSSDFSHISGFGSDFSPEEAKAKHLNARVFSNHQILSGALVKGVEIEKRSSIDLFYRASIARGEKILHTPFTIDAHWFDIGTPESYLKCASALSLHSKLIDSAVTDKVILIEPHTHADHADNGMLEQGCSNPQLITLDHARLDSPDLFAWLWLGHIHECPTLLQAPVSAITAHIKKNMQSISKPGALKCSTIDGGFLRQGGRVDAQADKRAQGFFTLNDPEKTGLKKTLPHPVMVRLDSLGLVTPSRESTQFWLLIH